MITPKTIYVYIYLALFYISAPLTVRFELLWNLPRTMSRKPAPQGTFEGCPGPSACPPVPHCWTYHGLSWLGRGFGNRPSPRGILRTSSPGCKPETSSNLLHSSLASAPSQITTMSASWTGAGLSRRVTNTPRSLGLTSSALHRTEFQTLISSTGQSTVEEGV